ncbi:hypothetical protein LZ31DRAFT_233107 [Colletotrichum somersetense]|nr:hypothetical protein LZ31DRAFT_233107 [Colletotrichum somersetense]
MAENRATQRPSPKTQSKAAPRRFPFPPRMSIGEVPSSHSPGPRVASVIGRARRPRLQPAGCSSSTRAQKTNALSRQRNQLETRTYPFLALHYLEAYSGREARDLHPPAGSPMPHIGKPQHKKRGRTKPSPPGNGYSLPVPCLLPHTVLAHAAHGLGRSFLSVQLNPRPHPNSGGESIWGQPVSTVHVHVQRRL